MRIRIGHGTTCNKPFTVARSARPPQLGQKQLCRPLQAASVETPDRAVDNPIGKSGDKSHETDYVVIGSGIGGLW